MGCLPMRGKCADTISLPAMSSCADITFPPWRGVLPRWGVPPSEKDVFAMRGRFNPPPRQPGMCRKFKIFIS